MAFAIEEREEDLDYDQFARHAGRTEAALTLSHKEISHMLALNRVDR